MLNRGGISQTLAFPEPSFHFFYFRLRRREGVGTTKRTNNERSLRAHSHAILTTHTGIVNTDGPGV